MVKPDMSVVEAIMRRAAEGMRDPDRVVLNPDHIYEDAQGNPLQPLIGPGLSVPCRACVMGHIRLATMEITGDPLGAGHGIIGKAWVTIGNFSAGHITADVAADDLDDLANTYKETQR